MWINGYKTYLGAALIAVSAAMTYLGMTEYSDVVLKIGEALGIAGLGHKLAKAAQ